MVSGGNGGGTVGEDGAVGFKHHAAQSGLGGVVEGGGADGGQVGPTVLAGFDQFEQDATGARTTEGAGAGEHGVRAFNGLDGEHKALLDDAGLADIGGAEQLDDGDGTRDIGEREGVGRGLSEQAGRAEGFGEDFVGAAYFEAFLGEDANDGFEQTVITGEGGATDAGEEFGAFGIRSKV